MPIMTKLDSASSQSPRPDENDAVGIESHENTKADDTEDGIATVTGREQDSANAVATEIQTVKADNQDPLLDPEFIIKQLDTRPVSQEQLVAEVKGIYAGLTVVESKCIEADRNHMPPNDGPLDVTKYLLMIPNAKLILLQDGNMYPEGAVRTWFTKVRKDATEGDTKPSTLKSTKESPATPTAPQAGSPKDYQHGFQVALESRAKEHKWPEYEEIATHNAAEISEEDRKKVMGGQYFLDFGYELVDQFLHDLETAKAKAEEKEAAKAKAEQEAAQAKEDNKDSSPDPEATPTHVGETQDNPEAQSRPSNGTQQAAPKETSPEQVKVALEEAAATQQHSAQDANLSPQQQQASPEEACVAPGDSGKDTADTAVDTVALNKKTKKPETEEPIYVDTRPLNNQKLYRKVGKQYWVLIGDQWIPSLNGEQYAALVALHRTLLCEHHDFFLASQHPNASPALRRLAKKYTMLARMWRHAIHSFLEVLHHRLPESQEIMDGFIILAYAMMSSLEETVPQFLSTWIECKGDLARYGVAIQSDNMEVRERWRETSKEEYTRVRDEDPTIGRIYHHLAILERPQSSPDADFDATVSKLFYYTKSLVVKNPFFTTRASVLFVIRPIVARNKEAAKKPASVHQTDKDHFLTAVAHLILASLEPETLRKHGHKDNRNDHLQDVYAALEKIKIGGPAETSRIRPSAQLGLLLCQLLLGIPLADGRWSPMMATWAPDLVTAEDRADSDAMANARDIHDATIELIHTMVPYLLEEADTRDLGVWGFIYVILVFMRSLKTRPALLEWFGSAFHAKVLAPFLNMLLREDETRGGLALESASQSELVTVCSLLNERQKPDEYGFSTEDIVRKYHREQEEQRKAERAKSTATVGEVAAEEAAAEDAMATPEESTVTTGETT
ncbi:hypothetical protein EDB80DRAFT_626217, partial [Ilyonectria destructans]